MARASPGSLRCSAAPGAAQAGMGFGAVADAVLAAPPALPRPRLSRLLPRRCSSPPRPIGVVVAADRPLHLLPGRDDPAQRAGRQTTAASRPRRIRRRASSTRSIWGLGCVAGDTALRRRLEHAVPRPCSSGVITTAARPCLRAARPAHGMPGKRLMRALTVLPIITPPFVIGLALILLFGRVGRRHRPAVRMVRHPALALDLRPAGRAAGAGAGLRADRLPRADRRRAGHQPEPRGGLADAAAPSAGRPSAP